MGVELLAPAAQKPAELEKEIPAIVAWAKALVIRTPGDYQEAAGKLMAIKGLAKKIADHYSPLKKSADAAKKAILDAEKKDALPLAEAEQIAKRVMTAYTEGERRRAEAERQRLQAEADERARREREALEKKSAAAVKPETKQKYQEAAAQVAAPVVNVAPAAPTVAGIVERKVWKARVVDPNLVPREYLIVNEKALDAIAKGLKEMAKIPGVEFFTETVMSASGR